MFFECGGSNSEMDVRILAVAFLLLTHPVRGLITASTVTSQQTPKETTAFVRAERVGESSSPPNLRQQPGEFAFEIDDTKYRLVSDGLGLRVDKTGGSTSFSIDVATGTWIIETFYYQAFDDLFLLAEIREQDACGGFLTRLAGDNLVHLWVVHVPSCNIGPAAVDGGFAYVTAWNFIAKVELDKGGYVWRHELKPDDHYYSFQTPRVERGIIRFVETDGGQRAPRVLVVEKETGDILSK